jgi:hypothetical protein
MPAVVDVVIAVPSTGGVCEVDLNRSAEDIFPVKLLYCGSSLVCGGELDEAIGGVAARKRVDGHVNVLAEILLV